MNRRKTSIDGFVARRPHRIELDKHSDAGSQTNLGHTNVNPKRSASLHSSRDDNVMPLSTPKKPSLVDDIDGSLKSIDSDVSDEQAKKRRRRKKRKSVKIVFLVLLMVMLATGGVLLYKAWVAGGKMFGGNMLDLFQQQQLKMDESGRSNVLIVGTTDDDPTRKAEGDGILTDSMMVVSVDQKNKDAYMFSIPRDLYVKYNMACLSGYEGKINVYFGCVEGGDSEEAQKKRLEGVRKFVGEIFDMDIQYAVHVKSNVVRDSVNAVGGITVDVQSRDPRGVLDASIDWMCTEAGLTPAQQRERCPTGHYIDFPNGPNDMDGDKAMWFSRARGVGFGATYGLEESNFDREQNQQLVMMALKNKATSAGVLTDVGKVMSLIDAMGDNLRTNVEAKEIQTIMRLTAELDMSQIHRLSFVEEDSPLMTTGMINGQSSVIPVAGQYNYSKIRKYLRDNIYATPLSKEGARVAVLNGGGEVGSAQAKADELEEIGMDISYVDNAPESIGRSYEIYQLTSPEGKPLTKSKLESLTGVKVISGQPPFAVAVDSDFIVVIGPSVGQNGI